MKVTEEFSTNYVQPILDDWDIPSGIGSGTGSVGAPIGGGYSTPSAPAYDTYQAPQQASPEPFWDSSAQAYNDGLGHYSYDGGNSWEGLRSQQPSYQPDPGVIPSGIGAGTGNWATYQAPAQQPFQSFSANEWDPSLATVGTAPYYSGGELDPAMATVGINPSDYGVEDTPWWLKQNPELPRAASDIRNPDPYATGYRPDPRFPEGQMMGDPLDYLLNTFGRPAAETAFQVTSPWKGGIEALPGGKGDVGDIFSGWQDLGNTAKQSGFNPNEFMDIQREKYKERPWYEQLAGDAIFDPLNLAGVGALKKVGLIDDTADLLKEGRTAIKLTKGTGLADEVIPGATHEMPAFAKDLFRDVDQDFNLATLGNKALPVGKDFDAAAFNAVDPEDLAFGARETAESTGMRSVDNVAESPRDAYAKVSDQAARLEDEAVRAFQAGDEAAAQQKWQTLDMLNERLHQLGNVLAGESGSTPTTFAARLGAQTALGAGLGAGYGEASGGDWKTGALVGAGIGAGTAVGFKAADRLASKGVAEKLAINKYPPPEAAQKLIDLLKEAKPIRGAQEELYSAERSRRAGIGLNVLKAGGDPQVAFKNARNAMAGELPKSPDFASVEHALTPDDLKSLLDHIRETPLRGKGNDFYTKINAETALVKALTGQLPTRSEIELLGKVFGEDLSKALLGKRSLGTKAWENFVDTINLPRTLMTAFDASAPLRQGAILFAGHPIKGLESTGVMLRAMASPEYAKLVDEAIQTSPNADIYEKMGLFFANVSPTGELTGREENMMSKLASNIPLVGGSQRGYNTFLNLMRQKIADGFIEAHPNLSDKEWRDFGHFINVATGRGDLPAKIADQGALMNAFFAPRYAISRFQLPVEMVKALKAGVPGASDAASREAARSLGSFVATGTALLTAGKMSGLWDVELDPRSTDFGKGKIGNQRFDFWAGEQQIARFATQMATGQRKTSTGDVIDASRKDIAERWLRTKVSPPVGIAWDAKEGKDAVGNPVDFKSKEGLATQAWNRLTPLFLQDMADAAKISGDPWRALSALPAVAGAGVQTYEDSDYKKREDAAVKAFGVPYEQLTNDQQLAIDESFGKLKPSSTESKSAAEMTAVLTDQQRASDSKLSSGQMTPEQWRKDYSDRKEERGLRSDQIWAATDFKDTKDPIKSAYYNFIDERATGPDGKVDWDKVDAYVARQSSSDQKWIEEHTGKIKLVTPQTQAFEKIYDDIEKSGYFERTDDNWSEVSKTLGIKGYTSYYDWLDAERKALLKSQGYDLWDVNAAFQADKVLDKYPAAKMMDELRTQWLAKWVAENPEEAYHAWQFGYYEPVADLKKFLAAQFEKPND